MGTKFNVPLYLNAPVEIALAAAAEEGQSQAPARVKIRAYDGGLMSPSGWGEVIVDLATLVLPAIVPLLTSHANTIDATAGSGKPAKAGGGIDFVGSLTRATETGRTVEQLARDGVPLQASIGLDVNGADITRLGPGDELTANGRKFTAGGNGLAYVKGAMLREVSVVPVGADANTSVALAAHFGNGHSEEHQINQGAGAIREIERARLARIDAVSSNPIGWGCVEDEEEIRKLRASAVCGDISIDDLEKGVLKALRASRASAPAAHIVARDDVANTQAFGSLEASLAMNLGLTEKMCGRFYDERTMNEAMSKSVRGAGLQTLMRGFLHATGSPMAQRKVDADFIRASFDSGRALQASGAGAGGYSTYSIPGILSNVQNKLLLQGFEAIKTTWTSFAATTNVKDFKPAVRYRLTMTGHFSTVGNGGDLKYVQMDEQAFPISVGTEGALISVTRQDIVNDDLGALQTAPKMLGRASALSIERAAYKLLISNAGAFFSVGNGNYVAGSGGALDFGNLETAWNMMMNQLDINGEPIMITPKTILTAPLNAIFARSVIRSQEVRDTTADLKYATGNPWQDSLVNVSSPWLATSTGVPGANDNGWYLFGDPNDVAAFMMAFLNGQMTPTIEEAPSAFDTLGMSFRAYHDFGCAFAEPRAAIFFQGHG